MNDEKNFLELTGFIKSKTEPIGNERRIIKKKKFLSRYLTLKY